MGTQIPDINRILVRARELHLCARCSAPAMYGHWHHRRTRSVKDDHQHCPCNGILLCAACHQWVHAYPLGAKATGHIVSRYIAQPFTAPFRRGDGAWVQPDCLGGYEFVAEPESPDIGTAGTVHPIAPAE